MLLGRILAWRGQGLRRCFSEFNLQFLCLHPRPFHCIFFPPSDACVRLLSSSHHDFSILPSLQLLRNTDDSKAVGGHHAADNMLPLSPDMLVAQRQKLMRLGQWTDTHSVRTCDSHSPFSSFVCSIEFQTFHLLAVNKFRWSS